MTTPSLTLMAPVDGVIVPLAEVPDPVFAEGTLGEGIALDPLGSTLCSPCDAEVIQCARTRHAVTLRTESGLELLLHLGLDTVNLDGQGIELCVEVGSRVRAGDPLCHFDVDRLAREATSLITPVIVTDSSGWRLLSTHSPASGTQIRRGEPLLTLEAVETGGTEGARAEGPVLSRELTLALAAGLHARPAARLRTIARRHAVALEVTVEQGSADAQSLSALMNLGLVAQSRLTLTARGEHAAMALDEAEALLTTPEKDEHAQGASTPDLPAAAEGQLPGLVASPGLALGPLVPYTLPLPRVPVDGEGEATERSRLRQALTQVGESLQASLRRAEQSGQVAEAEIFAAHQAWLEDPDLFAAAESRLRAGRSAGQAWREALDDEAERLMASGNVLLAGRVADLRDLQRQVMAELSDDVEQEVDLPDGAILLARDLTPSELVRVASERPAGICLAGGGTTSHVAILARARGIPCLVAMGERVLDTHGDRAVLDAERGFLEPAPDATRLAEVEAGIRDRVKRALEAREAAQAPATTLDGRVIEVCANIGSAAEARLAAEQGADGIGLMRSEFLFLERHSAPDEDDQQREYQAAVEALGGKPVIIRTLDIGADKQLPYLRLPETPNPALGVRGVRLWQRHPELLDTQLRALLQVEPLEALRIMVPMVSDVGELRWVRRRLQGLAEELGLSAMPRLGAMIEVPTAALCAASLAEEADFLSIGTNDLTQYALAMDREDPGLAARADVLHPGVLRLIQATVNGAAGKCPVGVCGAAAGDPQALALLVTLGVDELSVEPARVPAVKAALRQLDARALADELPAWLMLEDGEAVRQRLTDWYERVQFETTTTPERISS
ncbi:phosphoenolpyruvate--protein phosphotransferase [Litchfieldella qijiaojingensis]|uniref:phosphoenolpyruvate--protein phosphotransferase n=1 Tax=Litchfieldella qijiaojingensis TaxID=980347 RepID=A0ABQ2YRH9_9GAMM|nr:phosphoenolpyruvate--protein phosphotransferase [Halomonas qijiaojingensis]GGX91620.1 phosphoenolpyruvate--protein phosphotransferase [Halomonas qijiaojingensis]